MYKITRDFAGLTGTEVVYDLYTGTGTIAQFVSKNSKKVIGVDVDQRYDSTTVITSAMKGLGASVVQVLDAIYGGTWATYSGKTTYFNAANDGIGLPTMVIGSTASAFDRFSTFNKAAYDVVFAKLVAGTTTTPMIKRSITVAAASGVATAAELTTGLSLVKVDVTVR